MINYCLFPEPQTTAAPALAQVPLEAAKTLTETRVKEKKGAASHVLTEHVYDTRRTGSFY